MRTVCYHCGNYADGADHPNNLRSEIAHLQEQVEAVTRERDHWIAESRRNLQAGQDAAYKLEAAEAERDRLREALNKPTPTMIEDGVLAYNLTGIAGGIINTAEDHVEFIWQAMSAALQKEPQP